MWLFIITIVALFLLWTWITTPTHQIYDGTIETEKAHEEQEQSPSVDPKSVRALCEMSKAMTEHPHFFSALSLDPFAKDFNLIRMGIDHNHEGIKAIRLVFEELEKKAESNLDGPAAALALLDEDSLRIFLSWVEEKPGADGWTVDWEKHCGVELDI
ncbi:unnamed protein product [Clonostachys solani]|uniref:Uncharacterized protein n=1 Tax=Clonostachys solani TaxID=160281 RepID=A0A9P0EJ35_9HYPO|nr:unnamed protein product [Clonostachys solani]